MLAWFKNLMSSGSSAPRTVETLESRVVRVGTEYFLQIRFSPEDPWEYACGYHRGAEGPYNYQFDVTYNPWALVDHTLPEIMAELRRPTLPPDNIARAKRMKAQDPPSVDEVYDTRVLLADPYRPWRKLPGDH